MINDDFDCSALFRKMKNHSSSLIGIELNHDPVLRIGSFKTRHWQTSNSVDDQSSSTVCVGASLFGLIEICSSVFLENLAIESTPPPVMKRVEICAISARNIVEHYTRGIS